MDRQLKIAICCGGTGGHIFPGLATAQRLRKRGHAVTLWLAGKRTEHSALKGWQGETIVIPSEGFQFGFSPRSLLTFFRIAKATLHSIKIMFRERPDIVLAFGSYASAGPLAAAICLRIPYIVHEANLMPGRTVSLFSRRAAAVAISFEETRYYLHLKSIVTTGMPVRTALMEGVNSSAKRSGDELTILVMGGSAGSKALNENVPSAICALKEEGYPIRVIHLSGARDEEKVRQLYIASQVPSRVESFSSDMASLYREANLAICRAGASTCSELSLFQIPALLVPYPYATRNHQKFNASALEKRAAADLVDQVDLTPEWLQEYLIDIFKHPERLLKMRARMESHAPNDAAGRLSDLLEKMVPQK